MKRMFILSIISLIFATLVQASPLLLKPNAPSTYIVQDGDTLYSVADKFLVKPWQWKQLWRQNPAVTDPEHLHVGDTLTLRKEKGDYQLSVSKSARTKLSRHMNHARHSHNIPAIPLSKIEPFLNGSIVLNKDELPTSPYIVGYGNDRLVGGAGYTVFVSGVLKPNTQKFSVYRSEGRYVDPNSKEILGYAATYLGDADLVRPGNPSTLLLTFTTQDVHTGDRLLPARGDKFEPYYYPSAPRQSVKGVVIDAFGGMTQVGKDQVVVIDRGIRDGLRVGDILEIYKNGDVVPDPEHFGKAVKLPNQQNGELMIFRTFDKVSYGLVLKASSPIHIDDSVVNPT